MQGKQKNEVKQVLDKHLMDNRIIHANSEFVETSGPKTRTAKTVTYKDNTYDTKFVIKNEGLKSTITEVIAGSLYKTLLYDRSPTFTLVETSDKSSSTELKLKSKLLNNFITLSKFMCDKKEEKILNLIYEKSSNDHEKKELVEYLSFFGYSRSVGRFIDELNKKKEEVKGLEKFCDNVISQLDGIDRNIKLIESLPNFKEVLAQIFEKFKDQKRVVKDLFVGNLCLYGCCPLYEGMKIVHKNKSFLLSNTMSNLCGHRNDEYIKEIIDDLNSIYGSHNLFKIDKAETNKELIGKIKKFITERTEEIKNVEGIFKQINDYANKKLNEEVQGIEKLIVAMMLLGYGDMHGSNIGVMGVKYNDQEVIENVYAKIDMSASFYNLKYTHYLDYINEFKYLLYPSMQSLNIKIEYDINYNKLKEEINKACNLFIDNSEYVELLVHRALFYKKPLLKTAEELNLVKDLAGQIKTQAKLLREFANSEEFQFLKEYVTSECSDYKTWALDNGWKVNEEIQLQTTKMRSRNNDEKSVIEKITDAVKANLAQNSSYNKNCTIEEHRISCIKDNIQKAR